MGLSWYKGETGPGWLQEAEAAQAVLYFTNYIPGMPGG